MLKPVEKQRVAEEIVEQLRSLILTGQYPPGAKLPPERELAKTLGVNRASLREALKKLEHLGLVRIRQGDGTRVQNFMKTGGIELVSHLIPLAGSGRPEIVRDVLEFRAVFGRETARLGASRATDEDVARLVAIADKADAAEHEALFELDFDFYIAMTEATTNQVMGLLINSVRDAVKSHMGMLANLTISPEEVRKHHRRLIEAFRARDADAAANAADEYLQRGSAHAAKLLAGGLLNPVTE